jgi:hypothetical protein
MEHDPINPKHYPTLHAYLKTQAMLPWANKLDHIAMLVQKDIDEKENQEAIESYRESKSH